MSESTSDNTQVDVADDPSMEDILASIRKIIAEDDVTADISEPNDKILQNTDEDFSGLESLLREAEADETISLEEASDAQDFTDNQASTNNMSQADLVENELDSLMSELNLNDEENAPDSHTSLTIEDEDLTDLEEDRLVDDSIKEKINITSSVNQRDTNENDLEISELDVSDLDIEALLGDIETTSNTELDTIDSLLTDAEFSDTQGESLIIPDSETEQLEETEVGHQDHRQDPPELSEDDALFNELESLLDHTTSEGETHTDLGVVLDEGDEDLNELLEGLTIEGETEDALLEDLVSVSDDEIDKVLGDAVLDIDKDKLDTSNASITLETEKLDTFSTMNSEGADNEDPDIALVKSLMAELSDPDMIDPEDGQNYALSEDITDDDLSDMSLEALLEPELNDEADANVEETLNEELIEEDIAEAGLSYEDKHQANTPELETELETEPEISVERELDADDLLGSAEETDDDILEGILTAAVEADISDESDDLDALLAIPEQEIETSSWNEEAAPKTTEVLVDATPPSLENVIADEAENLALNDANLLSSSEASAKLDAESSLPTDEKEPRSSLMDIAYEAEKEASEMENSLNNKAQAEIVAENQNPYVGTTGFGALVLGASAVGATAITLNQKPSLNETQTVFKTDLTATEDFKQTDTLPKELLETQDMPNTATNSETILDEVSKEASASAFASLNKVVEDKAITAERGDRIGDLVMEVLRPMLKEWLDDNLQDIVERAVAKEVKRIASGD